MRRVLTVAALGVVAWAGTAAMAVPASAHPLGNFSVNVYNGIVIEPNAVHVEHVVDLAELPTVQAMPELDVNGDDVVAAGELDAFARDRCGTAVRALDVRIGGVSSALGLESSTATLADGQAGLSTVRIECEATGAVSLNGSEGVSFSDTSVTEEAGWHEVTLRGEGVTLSGADVPADSQSAALTAYPESLQSDPLRVTTASATVVASGAAVAGSNASSPDGAVEMSTVTESGKPWDWGAGLLSDATSTATGPVGMSVAVVVALLVGALHALAPGHGKSLVAFALAGREERAARAALTVGATVTVTHTASVLALGLLVAGTATVVTGELYSILGVITGVVVVALGVVLLRNALRRGGGGHGGHVGHSHGPGHGHTHGHCHPHDHAQEHGHHHAHDDAQKESDDEFSSIALKERTERHTREQVGQVEPGPGLPPARRGVLVTLGITGGLLPSPSAVVVLLASAASGRAWFGVILVVAFGVGMACTLAGVGFAVLRGQTRLLALADRSPSPRVARLVTLAPIVTASAVTVLGVVLLGAALV